MIFFLVKGHKTRKYSEKTPKIINFTVQNNTYTKTAIIKVEN